MVLNRFSGWLDYPEYYFFWNLHGNNSIFNISAYKNEAMDRLIDRARFTDDPAEYDKSVKDFVALCMREVPIIPLNQPIHDVAMQKAIGGYEFWFQPRARLSAIPEGLRPTTQDGWHVSPPSLPGSTPAIHLRSSSVALGWTPRINSIRSGTGEPDAQIPVLSFTSARLR